MNEQNILVTILARGKSERMGKDKLFLELNNKPLIQHTLDDLELAKKLVDIWLSNEFQQGRSGTKVDKINKIDKSA